MYDVCCGCVLTAVSVYFARHLFLQNNNRYMIDTWLPCLSVCLSVGRSVHPSVRQRVNQSELSVSPLCVRSSESNLNNTLPLRYTWKDDTSISEQGPAPQPAEEYIYKTLAGVSNQGPAPQPSGAGAIHMNKLGCPFINARPCQKTWEHLMSNRSSIHVPVFLSVLLILHWILSTCTCFSKTKCPACNILQGSTNSKAREGVWNLAILETNSPPGLFIWRNLNGVAWTKAHPYQICFSEKKATCLKVCSWRNMTTHDGRNMTTDETWRLQNTYPWRAVRRDPVAGGQVSTGDCQNKTPHRTSKLDNGALSPHRRTVHRRTDVGVTILNQFCCYEAAASW